MSNEENVNPEGLQSSPTSGCLILAMILFVFGGLVVLYTVVGLYQNRKIDSFTQDSAMEVTLVEPDAKETEVVLAKLTTIEAAVEEGKAIRVLFSSHDLNVLIASLDVLVDFRGNTFIDRISPQGIVADMAQPMRKGIVDKGMRYLNGTFVLRPQIRVRTVAFEVLDIRPREGEVPEGFIKNYAVLDFFRLDPENEHIEKHISSISAVYVEDGQLVVETGKDRTAPEG